MAGETEKSENEFRFRQQFFDYFFGVSDLDFTFLKMNPFTFVNGKPYPLDMRGELDDTVAFKNFKKWSNIEFPMPFGRVMSATERFINGLDEKDTLIIKPAKKSPILLRMVVLVFAMVCGVYICSVCLKQISTTSNIKIEDIQVIERPVSVNQPENLQIPVPHFPHPNTFNRAECAHNPMRYFAE